VWGGGGLGRCLPFVPPPPPPPPPPHTHTCTRPPTPQVFFREAAELALENMRSEALGVLAVMIQKNVRMWLQRRRYKVTLAAIVRIQGWMRMLLERVRYRRQVRAATKIQAFARMIKPRKAFLRIREENRRLREIERGRLKVRTSASFLMSRA
jgi:myosin heavy subunit